MLGAKEIEATKSNWESSAVFVTKIDGILHFCIVYRSSNSIRTGDLYSAPNGKECTDCLGESQIFLTWNDCSGYGKVVFYIDDKHKTALTTHQGPYQLEKDVAWF